VEKVERCCECLVVESLELVTDIPGEANFSLLTDMSIDMPGGHPATRRSLDLSAVLWAGARKGRLRAPGEHRGFRYGASIVDEDKIFPMRPRCSLGGRQCLMPSRRAFIGEEGIEMSKCDVRSRRVSMSDAATSSVHRPVKGVSNVIRGRGNRRRFVALESPPRRQLHAVDGNMYLGRLRHQVSLMYLGVHLRRNNSKVSTATRGLPGVASPTSQYDVRRYEIMRE
jgi:hypothetical protein